MRALSGRDQEAVEDLARELATWTDDGRSVLAAFVPRFHELMGFEKSIAFQLEETGPGLHLAAAHSMRIPKSCIEELGALMARSPVSWLGYNPLAPAPVQRNRVVGWPELRRLNPRVELTPLAQMQRKYDVTVRDQIRAFVCDGPSLLAWVGGYRSDAFTARERALFVALVPALRRRLALERQLEQVPIVSAALSVQLDEVGAAVFIVSDRGAIKHANAVGRAFLDHDRETIGAAVRAIVDGQSCPGWSATKLAISGIAPHWLLAHHADPSDATARLVVATQRWRLTEAEVRVLGLVVVGDANKTISAKLNRSIATVELHLTSLLRKSRCESRAALVALFWRGRK